ncbi:MULTISPECIES: polymer-forming cytoskeletal protein [Bacillus]|uniref:Cytoplasmic protein n=2 Tax=Bacillus cereus group TaxID=86661 RepID=R8QED0_BACCE|nr:MULTISPECIES: polymer-forming cytoskeletal protein [Bacillus cereus group]EOP69415.1 cytoplasmic protein [Bacillus cereus VD118]MBJ8091176.1 polymer-forming cytoskeletal protein [Bacillus cereus]MCQ6355651.1 polymer-forming cytoskeletal protein [Bacillus cereus]SCB68603.1 Cytoplasmic protein [Bacillus mycoides]
MENQHSLTVNGSGSSAGGDYNKVKIRGEGTISNNMSCNDFKTYGTSEVRGNMKAKNYVVYGDSEVQGNMEAEYVKVYGNAQVQGDGQINKTKVRGMIEFKGKLSGDFVDVKGALNVKGDIEVEELLLTGGLESDGLLNAENIEISLRYEGSKVREIGGKKITVRKKARFIPFTSHAGSLQTSIIEGDDIYLEHTIADVVRGNHVIIGPGCEISVVEYHTSFNQKGNSVVKEHKQI